MCEGGGGGGQGRCERRSEAFVKIQKGGGVGLGEGQGGCERRIEAFVKIKKEYIIFRRGGGGVGSEGVSGWEGGLGWM